ncbi:hypothetical protein MTBLM1_140025 [Rhodospirillaceae bacterium LM-1]|nr:hypothetical protein MTBLM1_140025 [Rhodospirillaceae bacterium LM-1]
MGARNILFQEEEGKATYVDVMFKRILEQQTTVA